MESTLRLSKWANPLAASLALGLLLVMGACETPYQEDGPDTLRGGVTSRMVSEDVYEIVVHTNGFSSNGRVHDFALLRGAEIAQREGAIGFIFVSAEDLTSSERVIGYGDGGRYSSAVGVMVVRPGSAVTMQLVREPTQVLAERRVYLASDILADLGPKYGLQ